MKEELHESCRLLYSLKVRTMMVHVFVSSRLHWTGEVIYTVLPSTLGPPNLKLNTHLVQNWAWAYRRGPR